MYGLSIYEIKRICHRVRFFIISHGIFQHFTNFLKNKQTNNRRPEYQVKIVVSFILISIITHDIKLLRKSEKIVIFPSRGKIMNDILNLSDDVVMMSSGKNEFLLQ